MRESYRPGIFNKNMLDEKINIQDEDAFEMSRRLACEEGIFVGMSSGAATFIAIQQARQMEEGLIVAILPDGGERYLSTELFAFKKETSTFYLHNAFARKKTLFNPIKTDEVSMRTCGPSIHDTPHLGNYRRLVVSDLISRYLTYKGYKIKHVLDIVDFGDKSIRGSEKESMELADYSQKYLQTFMEDTQYLNIHKDNIYVKASENFDTMLKIVEKLTDKDYAYEKLHSVYFNISKLTDYGVLSNIDLGKNRQGNSIDLDDYEKDSPADFALLKRSSLAELKRGIYHKTIWGNVRPSWHLECAAISNKYLGANYDIHVSGADEIFPHCENVLAINKAFSGHNGPNYWLNSELVMVEGRKMSRSLNNDVSLARLRQNGFSGSDVRFFLLSVHYRKPVNYSDGALQSAKNTVKKIHNFIHQLKIVSNDKHGDFAEVDQLIYDLKHGFMAALDDDLNIAGALAALFNFIGKLNSPLTQGIISKKNALDILAALQNINEVLGVMYFNEQVAQKEISELIAKREEARKSRNWEKADSYRTQLAELGVEVLDTSHGVVWRFN